MDRTVVSARFVLRVYLCLGWTGKSFEKPHVSELRHVCDLNHSFWNECFEMDGRLLRNQKRGLPMATCRSSYQTTLLCILRKRLCGERLRKNGDSDPCRCVLMELNENKPVMKPRYGKL
jgi:hypothetical protein